MCTQKHRSVQPYYADFHDSHISEEYHEAFVYVCVYGCRERGMQLAQLLQSKHTDTALEMLSAEPLLAWVRDDELVVILCT